LLEKFNGFIENTVAEIKNHVLRNRNLRATRDLLLPKLISGELDVSTLEGTSTQTLEAVGV